MAKRGEDVFELLDDWRHLPAYQLERRADIYFAMYLPELLAERFAESLLRWSEEAGARTISTKSRNTASIRWAGNSRLGCIWRIVGRLEFRRQHLVEFDDGRVDGQQ